MQPDNPIRLYPNTHACTCTPGFAASSVGMKPLPFTLHEIAANEEGAEEGGVMSAHPSGYKL